MAKKIPPNRARQIGDALRGEFPGTWVLENAVAPVTGVLPTGIDTLDVAIGVGGIPEGRFIIFHGPEASGKTTLLLELLIEVQRRGGVAVFMDFERKLDLAYAAAVGVDLRTLVLSKPKSIENGFHFMSKAIAKARSLDPDCPIVFGWDSLHAAAAKATMDAGYEDKRFPREAQAYAQCLQKFVPEMEESRAIVIAISQVRADLSGFVAKEKVAVGKAANFYASVVLQVRTKRQKGQTKAGLSGEMAEAIVRKNQVASPWGVAKIPIVYGHGVDRPAATFYAAETMGFVRPLRKEKGWSEIVIGERSVKIEGIAGMAILAQEDPETYEAIRAQIRAAIGHVEIARIEPKTDDELDREAEEDAIEVAKERAASGKDD